MSTVLGISGAFSTLRADVELPDYIFHDSSACLISDGEIISCQEEERLSRRKKTNHFPVRAISAVLEDSGISPEDIDEVRYYMPWYVLDRNLVDVYYYQKQIPSSYSRDLLFDRLVNDCGFPEDVTISCVKDHHRTHALTAIQSSPFQNGIALVLDGKGGIHSGAIYKFNQYSTELVKGYNVLESIGIMYAFATHHLGFSWGDEYKVMGLAPYGDPKKFRHLFYDHGGPSKELGYTLNIEKMRTGWTIAGFPVRRSGEPLSQHHKDFAASLQEFTESCVFGILDLISSKFPGLPLIFGGGVAHNSSLNGKILASGLFKNFFVHPASHDGGAALGAAIDAAIDIGDAPERKVWGDTFKGTTNLAVPATARSEWDSLLSFTTMTNPAHEVAEKLAEGKVIAFAEGRSEFGPRALGHRSILADPRNPKNRDHVNYVVKQREGFRPFAPVTLRSTANSWFNLPETKTEYTYMSHVVKAREDKKLQLGAVVHIDGTSRLQIVEDGASSLAKIISSFGEMTGVPVLLNTSFNNSHEPIVESFEDAVLTLLTTQLDGLVIGDTFIQARQQNEHALEHLSIRIPSDYSLRWDTFNESSTYSLVDNFAHTYKEDCTISKGLYEYLISLNSPSPINSVPKQLRKEVWSLVVKRKLQVSISKES